MRDSLGGGTFMTTLSIWRRLSLRERLFVSSVSLWIALPLLATTLGLELESWKAQRVLTLLFWLAPLALLGFSLALPRSRWRWIAISSMSLLTAASILPVSCAENEVASMQGAATDYSFEPILRQPHGGSELVLYRTNCGAPCSFGLVLRQQRRLFPGLRMTSQLGSWYPADTATLTWPSSELVRVAVAPYGERRPNPTITDVRVHTSLLWR